MSPLSSTVAAVRDHSRATPLPEIVDADHPTLRASHRTTASRAAAPRAMLPNDCGPIALHPLHLPSLPFRHLSGASMPYTITISILITIHRERGFDMNRAVLQTPTQPRQRPWRFAVTLLFPLSLARSAHATPPAPGRDRRSRAPRWPLLAVP